MQKKRMLYIMGIDWEWIYQRPQIFAEKLAQDYDVTVIFPRSITTRNAKLPKMSGMEFKILWTIPFQEKNAFLGWVSKIINKRLFRYINHYLYTIVGYPLYARYIPENYSGKLIYDCMDNHEALYPDTKRVERVLMQERKLIRDSDVLLVSGKKLKEKVDTVAGHEKSTLIRNGVMTNTINEIQQPQVKSKYYLCYVGTISEWFDYDVILSSLNQLPNIQYEMIGPAVQRIENTRIHYHGPQEHHNLGKLVEEYDCLIMPFRVNDIVEFVDPVKLYEYIAFGKCIISVYYAEIERFDEFVYFYKNTEEYVQLVQKLEREGFPPKYSAEQQKRFLHENTWDKRYEQLINKIKDIEQ